MDGYQRKLATVSDDEYLKDFIRKINNTSHQDFELKISKYLSVDKYLRWLAVAVCTQNLDGFIQNYALYRNSQTGLFEIIPWDYDATFGRDWNGDILDYHALPIEGYNTLSKKLLEIRNFRKQYQRLLEELLVTLFTLSTIEPKILSLTKSIRPHLSVQQSNQLDTEEEFIIQFIKARNLYVKKHLIFL